MYFRERFISIDMLVQWTSTSFLHHFRSLQFKPHASQIFLKSSETAESSS